MEAADYFDILNTVPTSEIQGVTFIGSVILLLRNTKTETATFIIYLAYLILHTACLIIHFWWTGIAQSVQRLATGWTVRRWNPNEGKIFCTRPDRLWGPSSLQHNGYRVSFPELNGRGLPFTTLPHLAPRLKKQWSYTLLSLFVFMSFSRAKFTVILSLYINGLQ